MDALHVDIDGHRIRRCFAPPPPPPSTGGPRCTVHVASLAKETGVTDCLLRWLSFSNVLWAEPLRPWPQDQEERFRRNGSESSLCSLRSSWSRYGRDMCLRPGIDNTYDVAAWKEEKVAAVQLSVPNTAAARWWRGRRRGRAAATTQTTTGRRVARFSPTRAA